MAQLTISTKPIAHTADQAPTLPRLALGRRPAALTALTVALIGAFLLSVALGSVNITLHDLLTVFIGGTPDRASATNIVLKVRLPLTLTALFSGAALGVSGLMMQTFFRNPLADPFTLGVSSGASFGVALVVLGTGAFSVPALTALGIPGEWVTVVAAGIGAMLSMSLVLLAANHVGNSLTLLILGVMFGYLTSAMISLLLYFSVPQQVDAFVAWSFGTFGRVTSGQLGIFTGVIGAGLIFSALLVKPLNALLLGEHYAQSMGLHVRLARLGIIAATGILAGTVTAFCGPISFIGLAVPHLARAILNTSDHRVLIPASMLTGGIVALLAGLIARVPGSQIILPLNAVTAVFGAPMVMWIILRRNQARGVFGS